MKSFQLLTREFNKYPNRINKRFYKALITKDFVFFVDYHEGDDNGNVEMYTRNMELVSDNYFASVGLHDVLTTGDWEYMSPTMRKNYKLALEAGQFEE